MGERRGRGEGVGVAKEVMNGEGFRTGGGGEVEYCEGSQLSVHKEENLPGTCNCASFSSALCDS